MTEKETAGERESFFFHGRGMPLLGTGISPSRPRRAQPWLKGFSTGARRQVHAVRLAGLRRRWGANALPPLLSVFPLGGEDGESALSADPPHAARIGPVDASTVCERAASEKTVAVPVVRSGDPPLTVPAPVAEFAGPTSPHPPLPEAPPPIGEPREGVGFEPGGREEGSRPAAAHHDGPTSQSARVVDAGEAPRAGAGRSGAELGAGTPRDLPSDSGPRVEAWRAPEATATGTGDGPQVAAHAEAPDRPPSRAASLASPREMSEPPARGAVSEDVALRWRGERPAPRSGHGSPARHGGSPPAAHSGFRPRVAPAVASVADATERSRADDSGSSMGKADDRSAQVWDELAGLAELLTARRRGRSSRPDPGRRVQIGTLHVTVMAQPKGEPAAMTPAAPGAVAPARSPGGAEAGPADPWSSYDAIFD